METYQDRRWYSQYSSKFLLAFLFRQLPWRMQKFEAPAGAAISVDGKSRVETISLFTTEQLRRRNIKQASLIEQLDF